MAGRAEQARVAAQARGRARGPASQDAAPGGGCLAGACGAQMEAAATPAPRGLATRGAAPAR
eukprot:15459823-Alexandrium_andersonii.AAC.1